VKSIKASCRMWCFRKVPHARKGGFGDRCLGDIDSGFEQIAMNSRGAVVASLEQTDSLNRIPAVREPGGPRQAAMQNCSLIRLTPIMIIQRVSRTASVG
jgi:hypothetical protein